MEEICERNNLKQAMERVISNKGKPGIDRMTTKQLKGYLVENWLTIKKQLMSGTYTPKAIRQVKIDKPEGGKRKLSIPCVVDRFIQQAILQVLQSKWDTKFSENSYGFRIGRSAHQAINQAQEYICEGNSYLVDIDLEKFFDEINHDRLMSKLAAQIKDKRILKLIRAYLQTGIMENGLITMQDKGANQGSPLSPFLSNVVLDELDKELEKREHKYVRYADDCNIYLKSKRAAERVMKSISEFIETRLKLKVNKSKSAVSTPYERKFLGFTFTLGRNPNRIMIADKLIV
ncbi:MAG: group II intron reverse transcriptase/maturase [Proteobacteria bacterium]|nr:group II intron reverse transcriptase/maturase [Pseudomonadota bacterium]